MANSIKSTYLPSIESNTSETKSTGIFENPSFSSSKSRMEVIAIKGPEFSKTDNKELLLDVNQDGLDDIVRVEKSADGYEQIVAYLNETPQCPGSYSFCHSSGVRFSAYPTVLVDKIKSDSIFNESQEQPQSITLSGVGDVNGDGASDIVFQADGETYAALGKAGPEYILFNEK